MKKNKDRESVVAGRFYEGDKNALKAEVEKYLTPQSKSDYLEDLIALIVPHAGYVFSGKIAGMGYKAIDPDKEYKNVFVIGSSHHVWFEGASVYNRGDYITPLGRVEVNKEIADELIASSKYFSFNPDAHSKEHSLEVQLPFLQVQLHKPFKIVPIVLGTQDPYVCRQLAKILKKYFVPGNLFVISSDFSHYPDYETAIEVDKQTAEAIMSNEPERLLKAVKDIKQRHDPNLLTGLCGWTSVLTLMYMTEGDNSIEYKHLGYMNSGDVPYYGDKNRVVGYNAIAVVKKQSDEEFTLTEEQKKLLLDVAHDELAKVVGAKSDIKLPPDEVLDKEVGAHAGAFVSLYNHGELRGCIGQFIGNKPLWRTVREMTDASATRDTRFYPVRKDELKDIKIEISVLTPLKKINDISEIKLGKHGIYIKKGYNSGTFLPQVATKTGWTLEEFLGHCARDKAHIGWDGWKDADIYTYEAIVFSDDDF
ncbi:MAG: AmmeMemoRadiSam system protein B [Chlorobi bacterium]|nr:AmmeMemoRadiSam system protein B [Chlorobiota bacterium]